ncbi:MAG: hypothetical protein QOF49_2337 [Chloroflexota bacterium]|jgi:hypothetical protein|nr:hypothetical protein [Chloroflexota bacterium]
MSNVDTISTRLDPQAMTGRQRAARILLATILGLETVWITFVLVDQIRVNGEFGLDYRWHLDAARRLLETGTPYWPWQLTGPFTIANGAILYPPIAFLLFIPFLWLPPVLWWAAPMAILAVGLAIHRPPLWAWAVIGAIFSYEKTLNVYVFGNPSMWVAAAIAAGTVLWWPFALVMVKPTFAPIALIGIRRRSWWIAGVVLGLASLPFGRAWLDWLAVVRNSDINLAYNLPTLPLMLVPLVAWLTGIRRPPTWRVRKPAAERDPVPTQIVR